MSDLVSGTKKLKKKSGPDALRKDAEKKLDERPPVSPEISGNVQEKLIHELQVHQIELEMQNEALREARIALEESHDNYLDLYEFAPVGYLTLSKKAVILEANLTSASLLGIDRRRFIKNRFRGFVAPEYLEQWDHHFIAAQHSPDKKTCDLELLKGDGSRFNARVVSTLIEREKKEPVIRVAISDITDIRTAEKALHTSRDRLTALLHNTSDIIRILDREGRIVFDTATSGEVLGYPPGFTIGKSPFEFIHPEDVPNIQREMARVFEKTNTGLPSEFRIRKADGTYVWVESVGKNLFGVSGIDGIVTTTRIIGERKKAEEALRESEARYSSLFDNSYSISILTNPDNGMIVDANEAAARYYGYSREQLTTMGIFDLNRLDKKTVIQNLIRRKTEGAKHFFSTHYLASGEQRSVEVYSGPIMVHEKPLFYSIIHDVTDKRKTEEALKASEEHFRGIFENAPVGIFHSLPDGAIIDVNPAYAKIFGYDSPEELIKIVNRHGVAETSYVHPALRAAYVRKVIESGTWQIFENQYYRKDGSIIYCLLSFRPLTNPVTGSQELEGFVVDISNLKKAEEDLQKSRQILEGILNTIPVRVFWKDKNLVYLGCNTPFAQDAGFEKPEDIIGKDDYRMGWREQAELYRADDRLVIESGRIKFLIEEPQTTPSGDQSHLLTSKVPLKDAKGEIIGVLGSYLDITDRKLMEEEVRSLNRVLEQRVAERTRELTCSNEQLAEEIKARTNAEETVRHSLDEKDLLLREIHHRVKNNLQIIASLLNLQSRYITDKKVLETLRDSQSRVRAMALVHERIYQSPEIGTINLAEYLRYLINQLFRFYNIPQSQVEISVDIDDIPADIDTAIPLGLIINELVSNALKHAFPEGRKGKISIEGAKMESGQLEFIFRDNGIGMPADYDWKNSHTLGLRLVKSLSKQLMGTADMVQDGGTVYTISVKQKQPFRRQETEETRELN